MALKVGLIVEEKAESHELGTCGQRRRSISLAVRGEQEE